MSNLAATLFWLEKGRIQLAIPYFLLLTPDEKAMVIDTFHGGEKVKNYINSLPPSLNERA